MTTRVGLAGYGLAGRVFHAPLIRAVEGLELSAVLTSSSERAHQIRVDHPDAEPVAELGALLDRSDVIVVATPNASHVEIAAAALERGLEVVIDKPPAPTAAEFRRLLCAAPSRITVFQNRRWDGDFLTAQRLVADDALGTVTRFESRFDRFVPEVASERWREHAGPQSGGGVLLDLGSHLVDQAVQLFGAPVSVYGEVLTRRAGALVDDDVFIALEHARGERSHLWMSKAAALPGPRIRLSGLAGGFSCEGFDPQERQLSDGLRPGDPGYGQGAPGTLEGRPVELERGRYEQFYSGVREWLAGSARPPVEPSDSLRVLEILEAARRSSEQRSIVAFCA